MMATGMGGSERARGASISATVMSGFGAAWLALGLTGAGAPAALVLAGTAAVFVAITLAGCALRRRLPEAPAEASLGAVEKTERRREQQAFLTVNVVQWVTILATVPLLNGRGLGAWVVPAIVLIVGAHFLPLAHIFRARQHWATGMALMLLAVTSPVVHGAQRDVVVSVAAGLILWVSAVVALRAAFRMMPSPGIVARV